MHACIFACMHTCMHTCIRKIMHPHTNIYIHINTYIRTCVHTYIHIYMHTYIHSCMHACIHTYMRTYMHTYIHTHMHACIQQCKSFHFAHTYFRTSARVPCLLRLQPLAAGSDGRLLEAFGLDWYRWHILKDNCMAIRLTRLAHEQNYELMRRTKTSSRKSSFFCFTAISVPDGFQQEDTQQ